MRTALALLVWLGSSATGLNVVVPPGVSCPSASDIERELRSVPGPGAGLPGDVLRVARTGDEISVSLEDAQHVVRGARKIRAAGTCVGIARTISLLVRAWQEGVALSAAPDAGAGPTSAPRAEAPRARQREFQILAKDEHRETEGPQRDGRFAADARETLALDAGTEPEVSDSGAERGAGAEPDAREGPDAGAQLAAPVEHSNVDAGETPTPGWSAVALGGVDPTSGQVIAAGLFRFERAIRGVWGVGVELHVQSPRTQPHAPGQVSVWTASLGLAARRTLFFAGTGSLELIAAAAAELLSASATGFTSNRGVLLAGFTASLSAEWNQPIVSGLCARAWVRFEAHPWAESLEIDNVGQVLVLPAVGGSAGLGVGWTF